MLDQGKGDKSRISDQARYAKNLSEIRCKCSKFKDVVTDDKCRECKEKNDGKIDE